MHSRYLVIAWIRSTAVYTNVTKCCKCLNHCKRLIVWNIWIAYLHRVFQSWKIARNTQFCDWKNNLTIDSSTCVKTFNIPSVINEFTGSFKHCWLQDIGCCFKNNLHFESLIRINSNTQKKFFFNVTSANWDNFVKNR